MKKKILLVDDEIGILKTVPRFIENENCEVIAAQNLKEAEAVLAEQTVNVIITDYSMPDIDGIELLKKVRDKYPDIVRILFSGYIEFNIITEAFNDNVFFRFIPKPWIDIDLVKIISDSLEKYDVQKNG